MQWVGEAVSFNFLGVVSVTEDEWSDVVDKVSLMKPSFQKLVPCSLAVSPKNEFILIVKVRSLVRKEVNEEQGLDLDAVVLTYALS